MLTISTTEMHANTAARRAQRDSLLETARQISAAIEPILIASWPCGTDEADELFEAAMSIAEPLAALAALCERKAWALF